MRQAFFRRYARRHQLVFIDPSDEFRSEFERTHQPRHGFQNSVMGSGHINAPGHEVLGGLLARAIVAETR